MCTLTRCHLGGYFDNSLQYIIVKYTVSYSNVLWVVRYGNVTIPSIQAQLHTSGATGMLFSITGVSWNFQCKYTPQYSWNLDIKAWQLTPDIFFQFLRLRTYVFLSELVPPSLESSLGSSQVLHNQTAELYNY